VKNRFKFSGILVAAAILAGCSTNGSSINPPVTRGNLNNDKLQVAVGTANIGFDGSIGLNVVTTLRQPNGLSAVLLDSPVITGPAGFVVTGAAPSGDAGTNHISSSPQSQNPPPCTTTFCVAGGAFSYGFAPYNSDNQGNPYPNGPALYPEPFYSATNPVPIAGGPPAYPFFNDGTFISGFVGYSQGFTAFETPVIAGAYSLSVTVPGPNGPAKTFNASATITNLAPLPAIAAPGFVSDGTGGGNLTVTVPADPRIVETMIYVMSDPGGNPNAGLLAYTIGPLSGTGLLAGALPDKLGPCSGSGCQNGPNAAQSMNTGDTYQIYAVSYDYPAFEAGPPGNKSQSPTIVGAGGQADVSISSVTAGTY
jgi:hypothetical protein